MQHLKSVKVKKVEVVSNEMVYDITVPGNHNFFANNVLSHNCYVILDEAENTTKDQMKLFLTRIGFNTTMAVNGDHTQSDLDKRTENGLTWAVRKLRGRESDISVIEFSKSDIVRSPLIGKILTHLESPDGKEFKPQQLNG